MLLQIENALLLTAAELQRQRQVAQDAKAEAEKARAGQEQSRALAELKEQLKHVSRSAR